MSALMNYIFESFCLSCMAKFPDLNAGSPDSAVTRQAVGVAEIKLSCSA